MTAGKNVKNGELPPHGGYRGLHPLLVAVIVFLVAAVASAALIWRLEQHRLREERARVINLAGDHAFDLQRRLDRTFSVTYALAALVRQGHGGITDFDEIARQLLPFYPGAVALQLAPGGVIRQVVPLAGNEKALGHDLLKDTSRNKEALLARDTGSLTLAGPFDLMQGGVGAVARLPVFLGDEQGNPAFWGFTTVLIRFPEVLGGTLLSQLAGRGFGFELWRIHPDTGKRQVIAASASFPLVAAVEHPLSVPNGIWTLSIAPVKGWGDPVGLSLNIALGLLFSLLLAWLAKLLVDSKAHETGLEAQVAERTAEIREREEQLRLFVEHAPASLAMLDRNMRFVQVSRRWLNDYGLGERDLQGLSHYDVFSEIPDSWKDAHRRGLAGEVVQADSDRFVRADGSVQWLQWEVRPWLDVEGEVGGIVIFTEDITERKRTEEALRYNELLLQEMGRVAKIGGWEFDPATGKGTWTEEVARIHDLDPDDETSFERGMDFYQGESRLKIEKAVQEAIELGKPYELDLELITANGAHKWVHIIGHPKVENGKVIQVRGSMQDITEHKKLETQYLHAQKMDSVGTLAGGVAHDFNNILTVIVGLGHLSLMKMADDDPHRRNITSILEAAERATYLTRELLLFSRKQESERRPVDLNDIIGKMEKFLHRIIGEDIILKRVPHSSPLPVLADSNHLEQVLMNLAVNARDAMPHGGEFILRTEQVVLDEEFAATHGYGKPGPYALLTVSDTGTGMERVIQQRIFEPFFSTKEVGKGTGLGLAVVYGIIKQHDGFITVYSEPGQGSTFRIYLPLTSAAARQETGAKQEQPVAGGTETILLAEDNDLVRDLVTSVLTDAGYRVIVAVDGEEAVRRFRENAGSIQLLLFDLIMPRMNGKEASDEIHKIQPGVKTIFASGYAPDIAQQKASLDNGSYLIYKPVSPHELLKKVRNVLDGTLQ